MRNYNKRRLKCFVYSRITEKPRCNLVIYTINRQLPFYLSKKAKHWNLKDVLFYMKFVKDLSSLLSVI